MHAFRFLLAAVALLLAWPAAADERHREPALPPGSTLTVVEALPVSSYDNRVQIQDGRLVSDAQRNRYAAHCTIGLRLGFRGDPPARIEPDTFEITAYRAWRGVSRDALDGLRLAQAAGGGGGGAFGTIRFHTRVELHSENQPQVDDMECVYTARPHRS